MCNEYKVRWVGGKWRWVHGGKGGHLAGEGAEDLNLDGVQYTFHIFPDRLAPVVRLGADGELELVPMRWGFPPLHEGGRPIVNARNLRSSYWRAWLEPQWRCLVPVTEFCEWTDAAPKQRRWFKLKDDVPFMFAAIWRPWRGTRGPRSEQVTGAHMLFAILTTEPNDVVAGVHARAMPVIIQRAEWMRWLTAPAHEAAPMARPAPAPDMAPPYEE